MKYLAFAAFCIALMACEFGSVYFGMSQGIQDAWSWTDSIAIGIFLGVVVVDTLREKT